MIENVMKDRTVEAIYRSYKDQPSWFSARLGASIIGHHCDRYLWLSFRWVLQKKFPGRMLKLFRRGQNEENQFVEDLRSVGVIVHDVDEQTGKQFTFTDCGGHFVDKIDGVALGIHEAPKTWHVLEFKTVSDKRFKQLEKQGVKKWDYKHWAQCQVGMHLAGLTRAYYLAVNKNDDSLYAERIHYNREEAALLIERARDIINLQQPPERTGSATHFLCKWCDYCEVCWHDRLPLFNCRTCCHSTLGENASWLCEKNKWELSYEQQNKGCEQHLFNPMIINAELVDYQGESVIYKQDKKRFANVTDTGFPNIDDGNFDFILTSQAMSEKRVEELVDRKG